jgi:transcriptional regulator with XRE-family HTH domain
MDNKIRKHASFEVGKRIKQFRKKLGLTQKEFAHRLGIPPNYISRYESGKHLPSSAVIKKMKDVYGLDDYWLATGISLEETKKAIGEKPSYDFIELLMESAAMKEASKILDFIFSTEKPYFTIDDLIREFNLSLNEAETIIKDTLYNGLIMNLGGGLYTVNIFFIFPRKDKKSDFFNNLMLLHLIYSYADEKTISEIENLFDRFYVKIKPVLDKFEQNTKPLKRK